MVIVLLNVNDRILLRCICYIDGIIVYICGFVLVGVIVMDEKEVVLVKLKNDLEVCKEDFCKIWFEDLFGELVFNDNMVVDI